MIEEFKNRWNRKIKRRKTVVSYPFRLQMLGLWFLATIVTLSVNYIYFPDHTTGYLLLNIVWMVWYAFLAVSGIKLIIKINSMITVIDKEVLS